MKCDICSVISFWITKHFLRFEAWSGANFDSFSVFGVHKKARDGRAAAYWTQQ